MLANPSDLRPPRTAFVIATLRHRLRILMVGGGAVAAAARFSTAWGHLLCSDEDGLDVDRELTIDVRTDDAESIAAAQARASVLITLALIGLSAGQGLLFHAAACADARGAAVLLVGPSGAGKTTAVSHLAGRTSYLSDETCLVDEDGGVVPYPKPLSVVRAGLEKAQTSPAELGLAIHPSGTAPVARVLVIDRRDEQAAGTPTVTRLGSVEGILAVIPQLSDLSSLPAPLVALARLNRRIGGFERLVYRDARDIDPAAGPPASPPLADGDLAYRLAPRRHPHEAGGRGLLQAPVDDAIEFSDALLTARGGEVTHLSGIAMTVWRETARPTPAAVLLDRLRAEHGRVPDDEEHFERVIHELIEAGVLEWRT